MPDSLDRLQSAVLEGGPLLSIDEAAGVLGVSPSTIRRMLSAGELHPTRLGGARHRPIRIFAGAINERLQGWTTR